MNQLSKTENDSLAALEQLWAKAPTGDRLVRLRFFALAFLGAPYLLGGCGEGLQGRHDQFPLFRVDAFDCLTYVNAVLALAYAQQADAILPNLMAVNYLSDTASYASRCHFMTSDWLVKNTHDRRLQWINQDLGFVLQSATGVLNRKQFFSYKKAEDLRLMEELSATEKAERMAELHALDESEAIDIAIAYCDWAELLANPQQLQASLPTISLMLVVRPREPFVQSCGMVTHLGFVLNEPDGLFFVHAKHNESVQKERLVDYFERFAGSPSIEGASFLGFGL